MTKQPASVHVVVVCRTPLAFLPLGNSSVVAHAVSRARAAEVSPQVSVWVDEALSPEWQKLPANLKPNCPVVLDGSLYQHAQDVVADVVLIHDSQRPLTLSSTFDRVAEAVIAGAVTARPAHVVVDTLKVVDESNVISNTLNRDLVQSLTSPEGYRRSALLDQTPRAGWSLATQDLQTSFVRGDQESIKVRAAEDVLLVESFLVWQTIS